MKKNHQKYRVAKSLSVRAYMVAVGAMSNRAIRSTAAGWSRARRWATRPPRSCPTTAKRSWPSARITATASAAMARLA